jgi:membrane-associated phospholipid phosphatase
MKPTAMGECRGCRRGSVWLLLLTCMGIEVCPARAQRQGEPPAIWVAAGASLAVLPSDHAVTAFAVAGTLCEELRRPWVTGLAYGTAGLVGWSRIHENRHWASDVVAGALVGAFAARLTVRHLHWNRAGSTVDDPMRLASRPAAVRVVPV